MSIGKKSMLVTSLIIMFIVGINSTVMFMTTRSTMVAQAEEKAIGVIKTFEATINESSLNMSEADFQNMLQKNLNDLNSGLPEVLDFTIYNLTDNPRAFASTDTAKIGKLADQEDIDAANNNQVITIVSNLGNENIEVDVTAPIVIQGQIKYVAGVTYSIKDEMIAANDLLISVILISVISVAIGLALMWLLYIKRMSQQLRGLKSITDEIAQGNLDLQIRVHSKDEIGALENNFNTMVQQLHALVYKIQNMSGTITNFSKQIQDSLTAATDTAENMASSAGEIAHGNVQQAEKIEVSSQKVAKVATGLDGMNKRIIVSNEITSKTTDIVSEGMETISLQKQKMLGSKQNVINTSIAINELEIQSHEVSAITDVINGISDQINLLALNAAIEAARAGEEGRGFSVVADEVRKLAEQSKNSTEKIYEIVSEIQRNTKNVVQEIARTKEAIEDQEVVVGKTVDQFRSIEESIKQLDEIVGTISEDARALNIEAEYVKENIQDVSEIAKKSIEGTDLLSAGSETQTSMMQEVLSMIEQLSTLSDELTDSTQQFRIRK